MPAFRKFTFDTSFDEGEIERAAKKAEERAAAERERLRVEAIKTEAHDEGFAEGKSAGLEEAHAEGEYIAAQALAEICRQLRHIAETQDKVLDQCKRDAIDAAMIIARKVLPEMSRKNAVGEIEGLITSSLDRLLGEPRIVVRVNDRILKMLQPRVSEIADQAGYNGKIILVTNNKFKDPDCRVEWADGSAERDISALWAEVDRVIDGYLQENGAASEGGDPDELAAQESEGGDPDELAAQESEGGDPDEHGGEEKQQEKQDKESPPSVVDLSPALRVEPAAETSESEKV